MSLTQLEKEKFDELKQIGWTSLQDEQRKMYKALKAKNETATLELSSTKKTEEAKTETVEVSKTQFEGIMARLDQLEAEKKAFQKAELPVGEWQPVDVSADLRTATMRRNGSDYGMGFIANDIYPKRVLNQKTGNIEYLYLCKWLKPDGSIEEGEMQLTEYAKLERVKVLLLKKHVQTMEKIVGETRRVNVRYEDYKTELGDKVPMRETADKISYTVQLPDKRELNVPEDVLNN